MYISSQSLDAEVWLFSTEGLKSPHVLDDKERKEAGMPLLPWLSTVLSKVFWDGVIAQSLVIVAAVLLPQVEPDSNAKMLWDDFADPRRAGSKDRDARSIAPGLSDGAIDGDCIMESMLDAGSNPRPNYTVENQSCQ
jgi:hypothetical protein